MKTAFLGYYQVNEAELQIIWNEGILILDTNVLLNLYRYPKNTSNDLIKLFKSVSERLWIPHQVALEYQENRLTTISEQLETYDEVKAILEKGWNNLQQAINALHLKTRHSFIDPGEFLMEIRAKFDEYIHELDTLRSEKPEIEHSATLQIIIDQLFDGKIGKHPISQDALDKIYQFGASRYALEVPPGYMDKDKDKELIKRGERTNYIYKGMSFERKYGDLIIWHQIIEEARDRHDFKKIIFITDDVKEDWWWKAKRPGFREKQIIGPRPELSAEILELANVTHFVMYQSDTFMENAKRYLGIDIKNESIEQVRDIKRLNQNLTSRSIMETYLLSERAFQTWLQASFPSDTITPHSFPSLIRQTKNGARIGYEVKLLPRHQHISYFSTLIENGYEQVLNGAIDDFILVIMLDDVASLREVTEKIHTLVNYLSRQISVTFGTLFYDENNSPKFVKLA